MKTKQISKNVAASRVARGRAKAADVAARGAEQIGNRLQEYRPTFRLQLVREEGVCYETRPLILSPSDAAQILVPLFWGEPYEKALVLPLSTCNRLIGIAEVGSGGVDASVVDPRRVFSALLICNAARFIFCHNHPSGNLNPSREDIRLAKQLREAGRVLNLYCDDAMIIGGNRWYSAALAGDM